MMDDSARRQLKGALLKCADENEHKVTPTFNVVVSSVCRSAVERITELEDLLEKVKQGKIKWVDYNAGEDCYEDTHEGHWEEVK